MTLGVEEEEYPPARPATAVHRAAGLQDAIAADEVQRELLQAQVERETADRGHRRGPRTAQGGRGHGRRGGRSTRHLPRRRSAERAAADPLRRDRCAADRAQPDADPRPRVVAPRPRVPLPGGRRAAVRHGSVLPDRPGRGLRPGSPGQRRRLPLPGPPHHRVGPPGGHRVRGDGADPRSALLEFADGGSATAVFSFESPQLRLGFVQHRPPPRGTRQEPPTRSSPTLPNPKTCQLLDAGHDPNCRPCGFTPADGIWHASCLGRYAEHRSF
ncbi:hypothetical protein CFP65_0024 [Kitasatospora sp. MMS16-BH015]|nr:hypothetical protein CFP65_0024 [Kitasatospora sp. MMS16-BH015]